jgi:hypothetical protein
MPTALAYLKAHKPGIPTSMFEEGDGADEHGNPTTIASERASFRWDDVSNLDYGLGRDQLQPRQVYSGCHS